MTSRNWSNGVAPALSAANMNGIEADLDKALSPATGKAQTSNLGLALDKYGVVLDKSTASWDNLYVESPFIVPDVGGRGWAMVYVGYGDTTGATRARIGLATSPDLLNWTKVGTAPILAQSGTGGAVDENGASGPSLHWDAANARWVLYYIGLTATGYEAGTKTICWATATNLTGTWTRQGAAISVGTGWRSGAVWHRSIVQRNGTWYMFFNATNGSGAEAIGYATAPSVSGPWTVDDVNSPVLSSGTGWESNYVGDPCVRRVGDLWVMDYYGFNGTNAADGVAFTTDSAFPLGWTKYTANPVLSKGASGDADAQSAHKPFVLTDGGTLYHFYTAVASTAISPRNIALATNRRLPVATSGTGLFTIPATAAARSSTATTLTPIAQSDWVFDRTGKTNLQYRVVMRANPGGGTLTFRPTCYSTGVVNQTVYGTMTGSAWTNASSPWVSVTGGTDSVIYGIIDWMVTSGTAQFGNAYLEFAWG